MAIEEFSGRVIAWQRRHGRHDLPWQANQKSRPDPYRVWLSEIMLQQTQVGTVIPYYERFVQRFPTLRALAAAPVDEVMAAWSGLGYYARARNLHRCACMVVAEHGGEFPASAAAIAEMPGIGRSTANAIAAACFGARVPILDGNVKRLLCRCFGIEGFPGSGPVERRLWELAEDLLPADDIGTYLQGQMDLGAMVCTRHKPRCASCPLADSCIARTEDRTDSLPEARPRAPLPQRHAEVLVLIDGGRVLLEQRPPSGIWGGLLSLPELAKGADPHAAAARLGCAAAGFAALPPLRHAFTHFRLTLAPLLAEVEAASVVREPGHVWLPLADLEAAALPTPIRAILRHVASSAPTPSRRTAQAVQHAQ
jgi:A/G-specific adenine glycosylase